jgi:flagellar biosynthesis protein FlhB
MGEEKSFEATPARLKRAKKEGDTPRSSELTATTAFSCAALGMFLVLPILQHAFTNIIIVSIREEEIPFATYGTCVACVFAVIAGGAMGSIAASFMQAGGISLRFRGVKFEKMNPVQGLRRMFSRDALVSAGKSCIVASAVVLALSPSFANTFTAIGQNAQREAIVMRAMGTVTAVTVGLGLFFGVIDVFLERKKWLRRLRMSYDEVKRDRKHQEGDPHMHNRRKQAHKALLRGSISRLRDAAFVVTNPTHIAVALEYRPPDVCVPRVLIRAIDEGAQLVKKRAKEMQVPIVENIELARILLASTQVGSYIPSKTYIAVAKIVACLVRT